MTDQHPKKLFLLDAMALIYRAYFAFSSNHRVTSKGLNTSAIFGFTITLLELLKKEKPSHIAVVFDTAAPTARHEEFADYKAHRAEMPEDISKAIPYIIRLIKGFRIPVISLDGYEADDIIGTLAKKAEQNGYVTYMMTPDKDFGQLVSENIFIYKPARQGLGAEILGPAEVCKRWDIKNVEQVKDILGLMGDSVDNIPGIPGVGEKTAMQLVKDFGSMENLLQNTDKLKGKLKEKVELNKELAIQSKRLATILLDVPVEFNESSLIMEEPDKETLGQLFTELEFRRMAEQVLGESLLQTAGNSSRTISPSVKAPSKTGQTDLFRQESDTDIEEMENVHSGKNDLSEPPSEPAVYKTINEVEHRYLLVDDEKKRMELIKVLNVAENFCFDTETTGLDVQTAELVGMSFAIKEKEAWYVPFPEDQDEARKIVQEFQPLFWDENVSKTGQNIKYDMAVLKKYGIEINGKLFDTMIAHFLIQPEMRHSMDLLSRIYLQYSPVSIETLIGKKGKAQLSMRSVPLETIKEYAAEDADITLQLQGKFEPMLALSGTRKLFDEVEMPLVPVLCDMESEGIKLDIAALNEYSGELEKEIIKSESEIQNLAGTKFNVSSPKQVGEILFEVLKITDKPKKTKTGQYATGEDILAKLSGKHLIVDKILEYRELVKLKNTYVDTLPSLVNTKTGRIHTSFNQVVAVTGRLSSDNPNLQNIPIRTPKGREIRKAFIPRSSEYLILSADYSQIELRIMAELSGDKSMMEAFISKEDIHTATAAKVYGVNLNEVNPDMRRNAKMVNFGIIYGISAFGLAERLNISRTESKGIIENYFRQYPRVKEYMDESIQRAREKGYVETMMGRKRYLQDINSNNPTVRGYAERNAINAPIQGSAADMIKIAMIEIHHEFKKMKVKSKMLIQVHDELVFDVFIDEIEMIKPVIEEKMKYAIKTKVPIEVEMGAGKNWLEAH